MKQISLDSPLGPVYVVAEGDRLTAVSFERERGAPVSKLSSPAPENSVLRRAIQQLSEYFDKKRRTFDLPLSQEGTAFQKSVWSALKKIPYGQTRSYSDVAGMIRNAKAVRAVGSANGRNAFCIVVPCHRVIAADGGLGGYSSGLRRKIQLLELESAPD